MTAGLLSYRDAVAALLPMRFSVRSLRRHTSRRTPASRRLRVVRFGHRTVGIRPIDLEKWKEAHLQ